MELDVLKRATADLGPKAFEQLIYKLTKLEHPAARHPAAPEHGADVVVADGGSASLVVQVKHYTTDRVNWKECERSLDRAVEHWKPATVRFAFPFQLSGKQLTSFRTRLGTRHASVVVELYDLTDLDDALEDNPKILRRYYPSLVERTDDLAHKVLQQIQQGNQPLANAPDAFDRAFGLGEFMAEDDPNFEYQTVIAGESKRLLEAAEPPYAVVREERGGEGVTLYTWPSEEAGQLLPEWTFTDDGEGHEARRQAELNLAAGREHTVRSGMRVIMSPAPTRVKQMLDRAGELLAADDGSEWQSTAELTLQPGPGAPLSATSGDETLTTTMYSVPPRGTDTHGWAGLADGRLIYAGVDLADGAGTFSLGSELLLGRDATENHAAIKFTRALFTCGGMEVESPLVPDGPAFIPVTKVPTNLQHVLAELQALYEAVMVVEQAAGTKLAVPESVPVEDARIVFWAARLLQGGAADAEDMAVNLSVEQAIAGPLAYRLATEQGGRLPLAPTVFGRRLYLGEVDIKAHKVGVTLEPAVPGSTLAQLQIKASGGVELKMVDRRSLIVLPGENDLIWRPGSP